jgi:hypothetical protein
VQQPQFNHLGNHIVGWENNIVTGSAGLKFGQQIFVGSVRVVNDANAILLFVIGQNLFVNIISPVINTQFGGQFRLPLSLGRFFVVGRLLFRFGFSIGRFLSISLSFG